MTEPAAVPATSPSASAMPAGDSVERTEEIETAFGTVRIEQIAKADAGHIDAGRLAVTYLKDGKVAKSFPKAVELGSMGAMGEFRVTNEFGALPVIVSKGGGTWQGSTCEWTVLTELRPAGPVELVSFESAFDDSGRNPGKATQAEGRIGEINADSSFAVDFTGSRSFTALYARQADGTYKLQGGKDKQLSGC